MKRRWDGSIQSSNAPIYNKSGIQRDDYNLYRCIVTNVTYADDPNNITKNSQNPEVLYDVVVLGGFQTGQGISNCRMAGHLGGNNNFEERILRPTSKELTGKRLEDQDGDIVFVQFIQGHFGYPVIVALGKGISDTVAATKAQGPRSIQQYNGIQQEINKDGEYTLSQFGGKVDGDLQTFVPETSVKYSQKVSKDGKVTETFESGLSIVKDSKADKVVVTTSGGAILTIDGSSQKMTLKAGSAEVDIDGSSGKISLKADNVDLGASTSDFVTLFSQLLSAFNSHTHMVPQAPAGLLPSQPPLAPLLSSVGSQTVKVQA